METLSHTDKLEGMLDSGEFVFENLTTAKQACSIPLHAHLDTRYVNNSDLYLGGYCQNIKFGGELGQRTEGKLKEILFRYIIDPILLSQKHTFSDELNCPCGTDQLFQGA